VPPDADPLALLRTRSYVKLLVLAGLVGVPVSVAAYGFLKLVAWLQQQLFTELPEALGFEAAPTWWPLPLLALSGLLVALAILHLPGTGGHSPADGFKAGGALPAEQLPGVVLAAVATLSFGVVLGPEAPLILMGSGLGVLAVRLAARDTPDKATAVVAAAGSFAAISSLLGSPLLGAFLLLEASGFGGPMLGLVLVPGLLAAGIGMLIFVGLDSLTGFGTFSLAIPGLPPFDRPTLALFGWAVVFGLVAPVLGRGIQLLAVAVRAHVERRMVLLMPVVGLGIAGLAIGFGEATGHSASNVLFSGQDDLGPLIGGAAGWSAGALVLLVLCKGLAYALALSSFRGGPVFPAMFIGAAAGMAASGLPGLELVPAIAMGIGAMSTVMLTLPLTATLLATLLLGSDGLTAMPLVIVAVVVAYVVTARQTPAAAGDRHRARATTTLNASRRALRDACGHESAVLKPWRLTRCGRCVLLDGHG
jgi:H+/Cl- antiporter ClcA